MFNSRLKYNLIFSEQEERFIDILLISISRSLHILSNFIRTFNHFSFSITNLTINKCIHTKYTYNDRLNSVIDYTAKKEKEIKKNQWRELISNSIGTNQPWKLVKYKVKSKWVQTTQTGSIASAANLHEKKKEQMKNGIKSSFFWWLMLFCFGTDERN